MNTHPQVGPPEKIEGDEANQAAIAIEVYKYAKDQEKAETARWKRLQTVAKEVLGWAMERIDTDTIQSDMGRAYMQAGYTRASYDTKALDALCKSDPNLALILSPHRVERDYNPRLVIK